jgi:hypothetical protein
MPQFVSKPHDVAKPNMLVSTLPCDVLRKASKLWVQVQDSHVRAYRALILEQKTGGPLT